MDEQFRNRLRRYDNGAPIGPRPNASRPQKTVTPQSASSPARSAGNVQPQGLKPKAPMNAQPLGHAPKPVPNMPHAGLTPKPKPYNQPTNFTKPASTPARPVFERPVARPKPVDPSKKAVPLAAIKNSNQKPKKRKGQRRGRKIAISLIVLALLVAAGVAVFWFGIRPRLSKPASSAQTQTRTNDTTKIANISTKPAPGKLIRLIAVGDSLTYNSVNLAAQKGGDYNYATMMSAIKPLMDKSAIRICSQTVPAGGAAAGGISGPPTFNAPPQFAKGLETTGCNVIDTASPNANDKGQAAIDASIANYDGSSNILAIAGTNRSAEDQKKIRYFTVEGMKFAYLAYTLKSNVTSSTPYGVNVYSEALVDAQVAEAHKNSAFVIVSMHWGADYSQDIDANQDTISQRLAAQNVDIVIGNGPRVIEPVKVLTGTKGHQTIIWFSLGNLLSSQVPVETLIGGMAVMDIDSSTQQLRNPRLLPLYMHYEWTAQQKASQSDADLLARKNFQLVPLDQATDLLAKSQNNTTVKAQQDRVETVISKYFKIPLTTSTQF